jgi:hypothetical protein
MVASQQSEPCPSEQGQLSQGAGVVVLQVAVEVSPNSGVAAMANLVTGKTRLITIKTAAIIYLYDSVIFIDYPKYAW